MCRNFIIYTVILFHLVGIVSSCDHGFCESFNLRRIPFDISYFKKHLKYTNGTDTLTLFPSVVDYSKQTKLNPIGNPDCNPVFAIEYSQRKSAVLEILYSFSYYPTEKNTDFDIIVGSSRKTMSINSSFRNKTIVLQKLDILNSSDSSRIFKTVILKNMKLIELETFSGEKWHLINF
jgi:hypothetical protein